MYRKLCAIALSVFTSATLLAQIHPSAEGGAGSSARIGVELSTFNPDYGCANSSPFSCWTHQLVGIAPFMDTRPMFFSRVGVEGQARFLSWRGPGSLSESSYMAGPHAGLFRYRQISLSGKMLAGKARLSVSNGAGGGSYFAYAPGGVVEYQVKPRLFLRADFEQQFWPNFKGIRTRTMDGTGGLTPSGLSLGVSYAIR
jgi:hypothetical protein